MVYNVCNHIALRYVCILVEWKKGATALLISSYQHNVDVKGRVFIPAKWRDDLGSTIIVTLGILGRDDGKCLFGMSLDAWTDFSSVLQNAPLGQIEAQRLMRSVMAGASDCEPDKQGRILIPAALREHAEIDKEAVLVGAGKRIEIWSAHMWQKQKELGNAITAEVLMDLSGLGI